MGFLFLLETLKQKQTHPLSLYVTPIQPKHFHNLKGKFNKRFECFKSQFWSKLRSMATAISTIIGKALPYINSFPQFSGQLVFMEAALGDQNLQNNG